MYIITDHKFNYYPFKQGQAMEKALNELLWLLGFVTSRAGNSVDPDHLASH